MMIDPAEHDWPRTSDADVHKAAEAGIPEAIEESRLRGLHRVDTDVDDGSDLVGDYDTGE